MAATKTKPMTDEERVDKMLADKATLENVAEQILIQGDDDSRFDPTETQVFDELGWDERKVRMERTRARNVHEAKRQFGSFAHIASAEHNAATMKAEAEERGPKIREQIEKLQAQLDTLDDAWRKYAREAEQRRAAMHRLRDGLLPEAIRKRRDKQRSAVKRSFHHLREAENRIRSIDQLLALNPSNVDDARQLDLVTSHKLRDQATPMTHGLVNINRSLYEVWADELRQEREGLQQMLADEGPQFTEAMSECDAMLDHYTGEPPEGFDMSKPELKSPGLPRAVTAPPGTHFDVVFGG